MPTEGTGQEQHSGRLGGSGRSTRRFGEGYRGQETAVVVESFQIKDADMGRITISDGDHQGVEVIVGELVSAGHRMREGADTCSNSIGLGASAERNRAFSEKPAKLPD